MVQPDVEDDRDARVEAEEGILVFAGFKYEIAVAPDAVSRADGRQRRADENRGVGLLLGQENLRRHPRGGRFAMRARDADGIRVVRRNRFEQPGARDDRHAALRRENHLGMVGRECDRVYDQLGTVEVRRVGGVVNGNAAVLQHLGLPGVRAVIAADDAAAPLEDHRQRGHAAAADADEINVFVFL